MFQAAVDRARLLIRQPEHVLRQAHAIYPRGTKTAARDQELPVVALWRGSVAEAFGQLGEIRRAEQWLDRAKEAWRLAGDATRIASVLARWAQLELRRAGDLVAAHRLLEEADSLTPPPDTEGWLLCRLARVELLDRTGDREPALALLGEVISTLEAHDAPPRRVIQAAIEGLVAAPSPDLLKLLVAQLERIDAVTARLALLGDLSRVRNMPAAEAGDALAALRRLTALPEELARSPDWAFLALSAAEVARLTGDEQYAGELISRGVLLLMEAGSRLAAAEWVRAATRLQGLAAGLPRWLHDFSKELSDFPLLRLELLVDAADAHVSRGDDEAAHEVLERSLRPLATASQERSNLLARIQELQSGLAQRRGDSVEAERCALAAIELYSKLGDRSSAERLRASLPEKSPTSFPVTPSSTTLQLVFRRRRGVTFVVATSDRSTHRFVSPAGSSSLIRFLDEAAAQDVAPNHVVDLLAEQPSLLATELSGILSLPKVAARVFPAGRWKPDLVLEIVDRQLQALPWELAIGRHLGTDARVCRTDSIERSGSEVVRNVHRLLGLVTDSHLEVDGVAGETTLAAVSRFQKSEGLAPDGIPGPATRARLRRALRRRSEAVPGQAIVVVRDLQVERQQSRGSLFHGIDPSMTYAELRFDGHRLSGSRVEAISEILLDHPRYQPLIVHFSCGLREVHGGIRLDLAEGDERWHQSSEASVVESFTPIMLDRFMRPMDASDLKPIVILDIPRPRGASETARSLLLRNAFAADLFALGGVSAVIATGLTLPGETKALYRRLLQPLAAGGSLAEAVSNVRAGPSGTDLEPDLGFAAIALFAHDPELGCTVLSRH
jgi:tetratricopeptide (TPR) repeat protein